MAEKAGRWKPNGALTGYTELARVLEIEALLSTAQARLQLWESLRDGQRRGEPWHKLPIVEAEQATQRQLEALREHHAFARRQAFEHPKAPPSAAVERAE